MPKKILKKKINKIGLFISDEGYGHSARQKTIIREFFNYNPKIQFTIFNGKRLLFLKEYFGNKLEYIYYPSTLHTVKKNKWRIRFKSYKKNFS